LERALEEQRDQVVKLEESLRHLQEDYTAAQKVWVDTKS
jgi:hypothetical protein